jgi:hypothetical protein
MIGTCRLCLTPHSELRNSHLISEFNYAPCYDGLHRFIRLSTAGPKHKWHEQKGYREPLLCQQCETKLSVWENYAKGILMDGGLYLIHRDPRGYVLGGADYALFRLYGLSLIWRMGVSSLPIFGEVQLRHHEERIRIALLNDDPLEPHQYPFLLTAVTVAGKFFPDFIVPPRLAKMDGFHIYRCVIGGIVYSFNIGSHRAEFALEDMALSREGILKIAVLPIEEVPFLHEHIGLVAQAIQKAKTARKSQRRSP